MDACQGKGVFELAKRYGHTRERATVLYIGSTRRSVSTLLDRMLGQIPGFLSVGELHYVWSRSFLQNQRCGCAQPFYSCEFWNAVGSEAFGGLDKVPADAILEVKRSVDRHRCIPHH